MEVQLIQTSEKSAIGTICFITYNRGNILLKSIKSLLPQISKEWPILVVDNASVKYTKQYNEIKRLAFKSKHLNYHRHNENGRVEGNLLSLFDLTETQFFIIVSDEDVPCLKTLNKMTPFLRENLDIGAIHTSLGTMPGVTQAQAHQCTDKIYEKGTGLGTFGLLGNYITGQIYNGPLLKKFNIPQRLKNNIYENRYYPHLYLNILAAANTRTALSSHVACLEGQIEEYLPEDKGRHSPFDYFGTFSYGTRVDQFIALRNALFEGYKDICNADPRKQLNMTEFYKAYLSLCAKYQFLILGANGAMYRDEHINLDLLSNSFSLFSISAVEKLPAFDFLKDSLATHIAQTGQYWLDQRHSFDKASLNESKKTNSSEKVLNSA